MYYLIPIRKNEYINNLKLAFPNETSGWYKNYSKMGYSFFTRQFIQFFAFPKTFEDAQINVIGLESLNKAFTKNRGVILVSGHIGAWEFLSAWLGSNRIPITAVASKQKNRGGNKFFIEHRGQFGMKHSYRRASLDNLYNILKKNHALGLVSDQDARKHGVFVKFFGRETSTPKGAAKFYLNSGAPIIFTICYQTKPNHYTIEFQDIKLNKKDTVQSITQKFTTVLEEYVKKYPEQYFWFHRRWKTQPPN